MLSPNPNNSKLTILDIDYATSFFFSFISGLTSCSFWCRITEGQHPTESTFHIKAFLIKQNMTSLKRLTRTNPNCLWPIVEHLESPWTNLAWRESSIVDLGNFPLKLNLESKYERIQWNEVQQEIVTFLLFY